MRYIYIIQNYFYLPLTLNTFVMNSVKYTGFISSSDFYFFMSFYTVLFKYLCTFLMKKLKIHNYGIGKND